MAWTLGGEYLARYIVDLIDAFCSNQDLPADINWSMMAFIEESGEAPQHAKALGMIFRHPLDTRPLSLKQADNKLVAGLLSFSFLLLLQMVLLISRLGLFKGVFLLRMLLSWISTPECKHSTVRRTQDIGDDSHFL